jgi:hypothetical protein
MSHSRMPPVPPAERSTKGPGSDPATARVTKNKHPEPGNTAEKGDTANIAQNTTNKGFFAGRRVK